jgi:HlyD family secretion protein
MNKGCLIGLVILLIALTCGLGYYFYNQRDKGPIQYESTKAEIRTVVNKAVATGSIKPRLEVQVKPQVSGVVDELYVAAGEIVKKGQKLAKIKLIPSEVNVNSARSNVELAQIRVTEAKRELARQKGVFDNSLDVQEAKRSFELAQQEEARQSELLKEGIVSTQDYQRVKLDLDIKKNAYENAKIRSSNTLDQFESQLEIRERELDAAMNNLQLLREGVTKSSQQVSNIVVSTVDGMVLDVPVEEGSSVIERNNFNEGTSIAIIADMTNIIFEGKVDESDVGKLKEGMPLVLTVGAIPDQKFDAILEFISPKGVEEQGTVKFEIKAAITSQPTGIFLRAGYSGNGDIIIDKRDSVIVVQERDVLYEEDKTYLEIVTGDQQYEKREISIGLSDGLYVEVITAMDTITAYKKRIDPAFEQK